VTWSVLPLFCFAIKTGNIKTENMKPTVRDRFRVLAG